MPLSAGPLPCGARRDGSEFSDDSFIWLTPLVARLPPLRHTPGLRASSPSLTAPGVLLFH
jgi:hypothetical protein